MNHLTIIHMKCIYTNKFYYYNTEVIVATLHYPPYILLHPNFDGMEARIIIEFCKIYNCRTSTLSDEDLWGTIFENGTGIGNMLYYVLYNVRCVISFKFKYHF